MTERRRLIRAVGFALLLCVLTTGLFVAAMRLWEGNLRVPFGYASDSLFYSMLIRSVQECGWYLSNPSLGAPFGLDLHDFKMQFFFFGLFAKVLSSFTGDYALILNLYFYATFLLAALAAAWVFKKLGFGWIVSGFGALYYAFLPYHFLRGVVHCTASAYYVVPLATFLAISLCRGDLLLPKRGDGWWGDTTRQWVRALLFCVLIALTDVYYAVFACYILLIAGLAQDLRRFSVARLLSTGILVAAITAVFLSSLIPQLAYEIAHGGNSLVAQRHPMEAEVYGLRALYLFVPGERMQSGQWIQQLLPHFEHVVSKWNESQTAYLGLTGGVGFLVVLGAFVLGGRRAAREPGLLTILSRLMVMVLLLGFSGGLGVLVAVLAVPEIRCYNRISAYVAFFSICGVVYLLDGIRRRCRSLPARAGYYIGIGVLALWALVDLNAPGLVPDYDWINSAWEDDSEFYARVTAILPEGSMVCQLPYMPFPESKSIQHLPDLDHLRAWLRAPSLRWSYGAMKGRSGDLWMKHHASQPFPAFMQAIRQIGFAAVYIDRNGLSPDDFAARVAYLEGELGCRPVWNRSERRVIYDLRDVRTELPPLSDDVLFPVLMEWGHDFYGLEGEPPTSWRWCGPKGTLMVSNPSSVRRDLVLKGTLSIPQFDGRVKVRLGGTEHVFEIMSGQVSMVLRAVIGPKEAVTVSFSCDAEAFDAPRDPRDLRFMLQNFTVEPGLAGR